MKRLAVVGLVVVAASALGPAAAQTPPAQAESQPVFKSGTELVALNVTVTDPRQNYVAGLAANDFAVYEDGVKQEVAFFAASEIPIDLILLVDSSSSMADKMASARWPRLVSFGRSAPAIARRSWRSTTRPRCFSR